MSPEPSAGAAWLTALTCCYGLIWTQTHTLSNGHIQVDNNTVKHSHIRAVTFPKKEKKRKFWLKIRLGITPLVEILTKQIGSQQQKTHIWTEKQSRDRGMLHNAWRWNGIELRERKPERKSDRKCRRSNEARVSRSGIKDTRKKLLGALEFILLSVSPFSPRSIASVTKTVY